MKMKQNFSPNLMAGIITLISIILVVVIFFIGKNKNLEPKSELEITDQKIAEANFNITFIEPQKVFNSIRKEDFLILDTRSNLQFQESHIESSTNIPFEELENDQNLPQDKNIIFVEANETIAGKELASKLKNLGYQLNYLQGGLEGYLNAGFNLVSSGNIVSLQDRAKTNPIDLKSLGEKLQNGERFVYLDVRKTESYTRDHFEKSINIPLENLEKNKKEIPTGKILIIDEDPIRSFKASVRLTDMNILSNYYLTNPYSELRNAIENRTLVEEQE
jgi:rhodanese-related sulfurtransferase